MAHGDADRNHPPFALRHSVFAIRYSRRSTNAPCRVRQVLENAKNGKGWLLAKVGMDLGSTPLSLGLGAVLLSIVDEANSPRAGHTSRGRLPSVEPLPAPHLVGPINGRLAFCPTRGVLQRGVGFRRERRQAGPRQRLGRRQQYDLVRQLRTEQPRRDGRASLAEDARD